MRLSRLLLTAAFASLCALPVRAAPQFSPDFERSAREALRDASLGLAEGSGGLKLEASFATADGGRIVRFQQLHHGVPVLGGSVVVRLDASLKPVRVSNHARPVLPGSVTPQVDAARALAIARGSLQGVALPEGGRPGNVALAIAAGRGGRLVWVVDVDTLVRTQARTVVVDAVTGAVLSSRERVFHGGKATVFDSGATAKAARKADGTFDGTGRVEVELRDLVETNPGSPLTGKDIVTVNCCPTEGCDPAKGPKRTSGKIQFDVPPNPFVPSPVNLTVNAVLCDEIPVARADADGNFHFEPTKEPKKDDPVPAPSEGEPFAEVMVHHTAQSTLDWVRTLDSGFMLGPSARPLHVTANFLIPDFKDLRNADITQVIATQTVTISHLARFSNAAFVPKGQSERLGAALPGFGHDYDSLIIAQGATADFGYDPDVVSHEFGHAVVGSVPGGLMEGQYSADDWGVLDSPGALNEAFADVIAAFRVDDPRIGEYVGAFELQGEGALRDLTNDFSCPTVLMGEVHQDSQHFAAACWSARTAVAGSSPSDRTRFDKAMLAALRSLQPDATFDEAGQALADEVGSLFDAAAKAKVEAVMKERKVTGCDRVLDLVPGTPRKGYFLAPADEASGWTPYAPGPVQFRLAVPKGTSSIRLSATAAPSPAGLSLGGFGGGGGAPSLQAILRSGERIHFAYGASGVTSDATKTLGFQGTNTLTVQLPIEASCSDATWFLALGNGGQGQFQLDELDVQFMTDAAKLAACDAPPAPDGGSGGAPGSGGDTASPGGCSCGAGGASTALLAGLAALGRRRRRAAD